MKLQRFLDDYYSISKGAVKLPLATLLSSYHNRYTELRKLHHTFKFTIWYVKPWNKTVVHFKVPSETVAGFFYDVLLELTNKDNATKFQDCHVKFFSNCPSFVYTYANVFYTMKDPDSGSESMIIDKFNQKIPKERLLVKDTEKKLGEEMATEKPVVRNPLGLALPDKSIYFAIFYLLDELNFRTVMHSKMNTTSITRLLTNVQDFDSLMVQRANLARKQAEQRKQIRKNIDRAFKEREKAINKPSSNMTKTPKTPKTQSKNTTKITGAKSGSGVRKITPTKRRK